MEPTATIPLRRDMFAGAEHALLRAGALTASLFRYPTGVEAVRLANGRGSVVVLPYMGGMVWGATFDGVDLAMRGLFDQPRPATSILDTYGCLAYHAGMLRNGPPGPGEDHPLHGEMPCMAMDEATLALGEDRDGPWIGVTSERDHARGFGSRYRARPSVALRAGASDFAVTIEVENLGAAPMDLMYICHANFAMPAGARIVQPVPFDAEHVAVRTAVPGHVKPSERYRALLAELAADPSRAEVLDEPSRFAPEQVFYVRGVEPGADGLARFMLRRREGDGFTVAFDPRAMPHTIRWLLSDGDQEVAAFAMPGTCEPEGYAAEARKNNVRRLAPGGRAAFTTRLGYADRAAADAFAAAVQGRG